jgi:hypothetical protein
MQAFFKNQGDPTMTKLNELIYRCKSRGTHAGGGGHEKLYKRPSKINPSNIMQE